jgi:hypothetical protein
MFTLATSYTDGTHTTIHSRHSSIQSAKRIASKLSCFGGNVHAEIYEGTSPMENDVPLWIGTRARFNHDPSRWVGTATWRKVK